jgi:hypothetical protein
MNTLYVSAASRARRTTGLGQLGKLGVEVSQGSLQDFAVARVLGSFKLLEHMLAGQQQALPPALAGDLGGSQRWLWWARHCSCFRLLLLDRLALPSSGQAEIIRAQVIAVPCFDLTLDQPLTRFRSNIGPTIDQVSI